MLRFRSGWAALPLAALGVSGCANLGSVPGGCGNGVVEDKEDCDQQDDHTSGSACGKPGSYAQCRWICSPSDSVPVACPTGWLCGVDDVCRQAPSPATWSGTAAATIAEDAARRLLVADFDGDGIDDIAAVTSGTVAIHFSEADRTSTPGDTIVAASPRPAVGILPGTSTDSAGTPLPGPPSLTLNLNHGLGVFTGQTDRSLSAVSFPALSFATGPATDRSHVIPFVIPGPVVTDQPSSITAIYAYDSGTAYEFVPPMPLPSTVGKWADTLAGPAIAGKFNPLRPCAALAVPLNGIGGGHVRVYNGCGPLDPIGYDVKLPVAVCSTCTGPVLHAVDFDNDGIPDLVAAGAGSPPPIYVAYSDGKGGFSDTPGGVANGSFAPAALPLLGTDNKPFPRTAPLALGDLNGDCIIDVVDPGNVWISTGKAPPGGCLPHTVTPSQTYVSYTAGDAAHPWTQGAVADMNADGRLDVVVASDDAPGVTIFRGTDTLLLNPYQVVTSSGIKSFSIGDFDGDLVADVAVIEAGEPDGSGNTQDTIAVSFGATSGPPSDAAVVGVVPNAETVVALIEEPISPDLVVNAGVLAYRDDATKDTHFADLYLFIGNTARQIDAPHLLLGLASESTVGMSGPDIPRRSVVGSFTGRKGLGDVAVFGKPVLGCTKNMSCASHIWILPTQAGGEITPAGTMEDKAKQYSLPAGLAGTDDVLLANYGAPAGSTFDTVAVAVSSSSAGDTDVYLVGDGTGAYDEATASKLTLKGFAISDPSGLGHLLVADVDGDGLRDLVLGSPAGGVAVVLARQASPPFDQSSKVATVPYATFTGLACAKEQPGSMVQPALGVAAVPAPIGANAQPLLVVVPQGTMELTWDQATGKLADPACLMQMPGGLAVATGDFDGDRIVDVVIAQAKTLGVYYGDAVAVGGADGGVQ